MPINTTYFLDGRFGNRLFQNHICHFIAKKTNLKMEYEFYNEIKSLGINLFCGKNQYQNNIQINDRNFMELIEHNINANIYIGKGVYGQTSDFAFYIQKYFTEIKDSIIIANEFKERYNTNNDVFVHIRLGDIVRDSRIIYQPFEYYDKALSLINFENGYISSDTITHPICKDLINKYNLISINMSETDTIKFGSTCKHIVLSSGTFSWFIGALSYDSNVYYTPCKIKWHGDIYVFPEWNKI